MYEGLSGYYKVTQILLDILSSNEDVNTVIHGRTEESSSKKNIFPVAHVAPRSSSFTYEGASIFTFRIGVFNLTEVSKDNVTDKFYGNDNQIDSFHSTHATLNYLIAKLRRDFNDDLDLISVTDALPMIYKKANLVTGWYIDISIAVPDNETNICD